MRAAFTAVVRITVSSISVAVIVLVFRVALHLNAATVGFTFLLAVLVVSAIWGLRYAVFEALLSTLAYNYFFLPPVGTFTISEPGNWVALIAFLVTAVIGSELSEKARTEAAKSNRRRQELERLYVFSRRLLSSDDVLSLASVIPEEIVQVFGATAAAVLLATPEQKVYHSGPTAQNIINRYDLQRFAGQAHVTFLVQENIAFTPLRFADFPAGVLGVAGSTLSRESIEAIGSLVAIAIERAGAVEKLAQTEAARESERVRSVLLDSVTHDFRTPLTAIKASAQSLSDDIELDDIARQELLSVITEESDRLDRLVGEAAQMAQLDSNNFKLELVPHHISEAIDLAIASNKHVLARHHIQIEANESLPLVQIDLLRIEEVLAQFLDNAAKYSPPGTTISITAALIGECLVTSVADEGPGIETTEQARVFDKFYRGDRRRTSVQGTGMGLAIARGIVELHGGTVGVTSQPGHGSVFNFSLPLTSDASSH